jgi:outer membrane protein assembly factor BamB
VIHAIPGLGFVVALLAGCGGSGGATFVAVECDGTAIGTSGPCPLTIDASTTPGRVPGVVTVGPPATPTGGGAREAGVGDASDLQNPSDYATYLANAAHTNAANDGSLVPPLRRIWAMPLGQLVSYPLIVDNLVYVTTAATQTQHARALALQRETGETTWRFDLGAAQTGYLTYEAGRVFEVDTEVSTGGAMLRALDAQGGTADWQVPVIGNQPISTAPPLAYGGVLYVLGAGTGGTLYAVDEGTGTLGWQALLSNGPSGPPAISGDGIFVFGESGDTSAFGFGGNTLWQNRDESGTGVAAPVLVDHTLYEARYPFNALVDTRTGASVATTFMTDRPPAFGEGFEFDVIKGVLRATQMASGAAVWTFAPGGGVATSPLIDGNTVFVGSTIGTIFALDAMTGVVEWSESTGADFLTQQGFGMAAAHGVLVVPAGNELLAYVSAGADADAGPRLYGGADGGCPWALADAPPSAMTPGTPSSLATADFNRDGRPDLAIGNDVMLGAGDGTFSTVVQGKGSFSEGLDVLAVADVDGDGKPDVIGASFYQAMQSPQNVSVSLGVGDGSFQAPELYAAGEYPEAIAVADFNGDGHPDFVVAGDGARVFLNQGDGTFGSPVAYVADAGVAPVATADLNGDGHPDIVLAQGYPAPEAIVLVGNGAGTFGASASVPMGSAATAIAVGDLNGDGKVDLVSAGSDVEVFLGNGDGTFGAPADYTAGQDPSGVAIGDVDGDGHPDLVVANTSSGSMSVFFGLGDGTFAWQLAYATGAGPVSPIIGDFNGDGRPDIVTSDLDANAISVFLGTCGPAGP